MHAHMYHVYVPHMPLMLLQSRGTCDKKSPSRMCQAQELREGGQEPYAYTYERTHMSAELHEQFKGLGDGEVADLEVPAWPIACTSGCRVHLRIHTY